MDQAEIIARINSFPRWHYQFDLKGSLTPIFERGHANRHIQRKKYFFDPLVARLGGSLVGKRVLDLGCNAGFWSLCAAQSGCDYVLGIDGRQMHIDQANFVFEVNEVDKRRYQFVCGNIFEADLRQFGMFDIVFCFGLMYHISKPIELMEKISQVNSDILLIDTAILGLPGSFLGIRRNPLDEPRSSVDYEVVFLPTKQALCDIVRQFSYQVMMLKPAFSDHGGALDYQYRQRRAFLCAKQSDISKWRLLTESNSLPRQLLDPFFLLAFILRKLPFFVKRRLSRRKRR